jgi:hypothetical protein
MNDEKAQAAFQAMSNFVNIMGHGQKEFIALMERDHPTLQQQFTGLCLAWLRHVASKEYRTDGRNEYSQKIARKLMRDIEPYEIFMPLI